MRPSGAVVGSGSLTLMHSTGEYSLNCVDSNVVAFSCETRRVGHLRRGRRAAGQPTLDRTVQDELGTLEIGAMAEMV